LHNLHFVPVENEQILCYLKTTPALDNVLLVAVTLDPWNGQSGWLDLPLEFLGLAESGNFLMHDLLSGERFWWHGSRNYIALDPHTRPAHIFRLQR
jgi:starch synthase (maltosyl-transferring)